MGLRMGSRMFSGLAAMALLLAIAGIYGVMAFAVLQRTHEIGVRMALGADKASVLGLVIRQGMMPVAIGIVLGVVGSLALSRGFHCCCGLPDRRCGLGAATCDLHSLADRRARSLATAVGR